MMNNQPTTTTRPDTRPLRWTFDQVNQSLITEQHWAAQVGADEVLLKVDIRRNAYDNQSYATVAVIDRTTGTANIIATRPITELRIAEWSYTTRDERWTDDIADDAAQLADEAATILNLQIV